MDFIKSRLTGLGVALAMLTWSTVGFAGTGHYLPV